MILVEASPYDNVWGIGLHATDPRAKDMQRWRGQNKLGFLLMVVRYYLPHDLVVPKLTAYGMSPSAIKLITNYLRHRQQELK